MTGTSSRTAITLWRIATDTPDYGADDMTGIGAERTGGRWNRKGTPMVYASTSRALACLETLVHLGSARLPLNRYLVEISVPVELWETREKAHADHLVGWDAEPPGLVSMNWGTAWAIGASSILAEVPSVVIPEDTNVLINPRHPDSSKLTAKKVRRWTYDARLSV